MAGVLSDEPFCLAVHLLSELSNSLAVRLLKHLSFDFPTLPLDAFGVMFFFQDRCFSNVTSAHTRDCKAAKLQAKISLFSFGKQHISLMLMLCQDAP